MILIQRPLIVLIWLGLVNGVIWVMLAIPVVWAQSAASAAATARAVDQIDTRVQRLETGAVDTTAGIATLTERMSSLAARMDSFYATLLDVQQTQSNLLLMALGFFATTCGGLIATLWSIRKGWLKSG